MAQTTLLLNGFSIIGDPQTNSNAANGGNLFVHNGTAVFEADDIIVFTVEGATVDGVLTDDSVITGITVYDNASDYFYDSPLYTYTALPDLEVDIDYGRNTMGDRYLEFDATTLVSTDAGAPVLGEMALVAGVDILGTLATTTGPLRVPTTEAIDIDGDGVITADEQGDASFSSDLNIFAVVCFAAGSLIETPQGPQFIETLAVGDLVNTLDDGPQPIRWIGAQRVAGQGPMAPVVIAPGALGNIRQLVVSQNHRMLVTGARAELLFGQREVLVAAKHLVDGEKIRIEARAQVTYYHFLLDAHQIVFAEGCPAESLLAGAQTLATLPPEDRDEILAVFPDLTHDAAPMDASRYALRQFEAMALRRIA